ncbi:MAG: 50S ribosomal protein L29 [Actinobacteria bacterium]|nr:50S ribosomal protein L29 [Actinomycetota bacterium]MBU2686922.1 50S ribosomal protein L29 [Actinomycetota bacterium]
MLTARELRVLDSGELEDKLRELKETLFNLRFQHATGQLDNPMKIKEARRDIARVCTVMTEREFAIHAEAFEAAEEYVAMEEPEELAVTEEEELADEEELAIEAEPVETEEQLEEEVEEELRDL